MIMGFQPLPSKDLKKTSQLRYANLSEMAVLLPVSKNHRTRRVSAENTREKNLLLIEI